MLNLLTQTAFSGRASPSARVVGQGSFRLPPLSNPRVEESRL